MWFVDAFEMGCNFGIIVSLRLIVVAGAAAPIIGDDNDDDGTIGKSGRVLAITGTITGGFSFRIGRELIVFVLLCIGADGTFDLKWIVWMVCTRFGTDTAVAVVVTAAVTDCVGGGGVGVWAIGGWTRFTAADDMVVDGNCIILFTVGGRIVLLDMIDICWLSGRGLFTEAVEK